MENCLKERVHDWQNASKAVSDIYLKIIEFEQAKTYNKDYHALKDLLPYMVEREKRLFMEIGLTKSSYKELIEELELPKERIINFYNVETRDIADLRMIAIFKSIVLNEYENFIDKHKASAAMELVEFSNKELNERYLEAETINFIAMIEKYNSELDDKAVNNYLVYLKYLLIATTPRYEKAYLDFHQNILPTGNILSMFSGKEEYPEVYLELCLRTYVSSTLLEDLYYLVNVTDFVYYFQRNAIYRMLAQSKALLISFKDMRFLNELEEKTKVKMKNDSSHSIINKLINEMFADAKELIKKDYYVPKKNG